MSVESHTQPLPDVDFLPAATYDDRLIARCWEKRDLRPTVVDVIKNPQDLILLVRSSKGPGEWGLVQGGIDRDETVPRAAVREPYEEVNIRPRDLIVGRVTDRVALSAPPRRGFSKGNLYLVTQVDYIGSGDELKIDESELSDMGWFNLDQIKAKIVDKRHQKQKLIIRAVQDALSGRI